MIEYDPGQETSLMLANDMQWDSLLEDLEPADAWQKPPSLWEE